MAKRKNHGKPAADHTVPAAPAVPETAAKDDGGLVSVVPVDAAQAPGDAPADAGAAAGGALAEGSDGAGTDPAPAAGDAGTAEPAGPAEGDRVVNVEYGRVQSIDGDTAEVLWEISGCIGDIDADRLHLANNVIVTFVTNGTGAAEPAAGESDTVDRNVDKALWSAGIAYSRQGTSWDFITGVQSHEYADIEGPAKTAAAFLRQWPDGKPEAIVIHLRRAGFKDVPEPGRRELAAWKVFAVTLAELDAIDRAEAEERAAAEAAANPAPAARYPLDLAMQPQPGPFDPAGFSPRR